jgi:hypothetical protein
MHIWYLSQVSLADDLDAPSQQYVASQFRHPRLRAISVQQPLADAVLCGYKRIEGRHNPMKLPKKGGLWLALQVESLLHPHAFVTLDAPNPKLSINRNTSWLGSLFSPSLSLLSLSLFPSLPPSTILQTTKVLSPDTENPAQRAGRALSRPLYKLSSHVRVSTAMAKMPPDTHQQKEAGLYCGVDPHKGMRPGACLP